MCFRTLSSCGNAAKNEKNAIKALKTDTDRLESKTSREKRCYVSASARVKRFSLAWNLLCVGFSDREMLRHPKTQTNLSMFWSFLTKSCLKKHQRRRFYLFQDQTLILHYCDIRTEAASGHAPPIVTHVVWFFAARAVRAHLRLMGLSNRSSRWGRGKLQERLADFITEWQLVF